MDTTLRKRQTSFRFRPELIDMLKERASRSNRSLNSYVEMVLTDAVFDEPNEETIQAIEESRRGIYAGTIDTSSVDAMVKSILG